MTDVTNDPIVGAIDRVRATAVLLRGEADDLTQVAADLEATLPPPNLPPEGITLSVGEVPESVEVGERVATITAHDPEGGELTFSVESEVFVLCEGDGLCVAAPLDAEERSIEQVTINASDGENTISAEFGIEVTRVEEPPPVPMEDWGSLESVARMVQPGQWLHWSDPATKFTEGENTGRDFPETSMWPSDDEWMGLEGIVKAAAARGTTGTHVPYWGGGAVSPDGRIFIHGGGHSSDCIETPCFDAKAGKWSMFRPNWSVPHGDRDPLIGNTRWPSPENGESPTSVHMYGGLICTQSGTLYRFGGATYPAGSGTNEAWRTDTSEPDGKWQQCTRMPETTYANATTFVDPDGVERIFVAGGRLYEYVPANDSPELAAESVALWRQVLEAEQARKVAGAALKAGETQEEIDALKAAYEAADALYDRLRVDFRALISGEGKPWQILADTSSAKMVGYHPELDAIFIHGRNPQLVFLSDPQKVVGWKRTGNVPLTEENTVLFWETANTWDPKRKCHWFWNARPRPRHLWTLTFSQIDGAWEGEFRFVENPVGPAPTPFFVNRDGVFYTGRRGNQQSQGKLVYFPEYDVFLAYVDVNEGWWVYRPNDGIPPLAEKTGGHEVAFEDPTPRYLVNPTPTPPMIEGDYRVNPAMSDSADDYPTVEDLMEAVDLSVGDPLKIVLAPGLHADIELENAVNATLIAEPGAWLGSPDGEWSSRPAIRLGGKRGWCDGVSILGLLIQNRGRGIDADWGTITFTVQGCAFSNNGMHIQAHSAERNPENALGTAVTLIDDCVFFKTGNKEFSHGIYLSGNLGGRAVITNNRMLRFGSGGHGFKVGTASALIENNQILMLDGFGSPPIDIVTGGDYVIRNNVIQAGPRRDNSEMVRIATSKRRAVVQSGGVWEPPVHNTLLEGNTYIFDGGEAKSGVVNSLSPGPITVRNETLVNVRGGLAKFPDPLGITNPWVFPAANPRPSSSLAKPLSEAENVTIENSTTFATREEAGLPPYEEQI